MSEAEDRVPPPKSAAHRDALLAAAAPARIALGANRSDRLLRLFDFLLEKTLAGESPSEQQIAAQAFGTGRSFEAGQDANIRVYVHRLRKALQAAEPSPDGSRLAIPLGEYRIRLVGPANREAAVAAEAGPSATGTRQRGSAFRLLRNPWLFVVLIAMAAAGVGWWALIRQSSPLADVPVWRDLASSERPLVIVAGDYYLFAKVDPARPAPGTQPQLIWDRTVPTSEDLTIKQMLDPAQADSLVDYGQQFVSAGTIEALSLVRASVAGVPALRRKTVKLIAASQLTPETLGSADILYIGPLSALPVLLRDPLSQASGFRIEPGFGGLTDLGTGRRYQSDGMVLTDERIPRRDYAYLVGLPGPGGNRLVIAAGLGEAGLKEAVRVLGDPDRMRRAGQALPDGGQGFEILQRVRTIRDVNMGATPVLARPLRSSGIWDNPGNVAPYRPLDEPGATAPPPSPGDRD